MRFADQAYEGRMRFVRAEGINMVIKELDTMLINDWFEFFENRAFSDHEEWKGCYCTAFFSPRFNGYKNVSKSRKEYAEWLIENEKMKGYLAYENGQVIGWVNVNDKADFPRLYDIYDSNEKIMSIVCFIVQKEHRRKGIAQRLLSRTLNDSKEKGYSIIEAYPKKRAASEYGIWNGPYEMYIKNGFEDYKIDKTNVVRKYIIQP